jgi:hypothetical protein
MIALNGYGGFCLEEGVPSHDTLGRVLGMIKSDFIYQIFEAVVIEILKIGGAPAGKERQIAVYDKAVRG